MKQHIQKHSLQDGESVLPHTRNTHNRRQSLQSNDYKDRMIPSRKSTEMCLRRSSSRLKSPPVQKMGSYERYLSQQMLPEKKNQFCSAMDIRKMMYKEPASTRLRPPISPYRSLKVSGWSNEFYSNLLDWSYNNYIGIGSGRSVNVINPYNQGSLLVKKQGHALSFNFPKDISSVAFSPNSAKYAVGLTSGRFQIVDYVKGREVLSLAMLSERISALEWKDVILYGGRNCEVHVFDIRSPLSVGILHSGRAEICGIKQHGNLIAFGNNNNAVVIFDMRKAQMIDKYYHMACVKALCWDRQGENLYSGGGCTDRKILKWSAKESAIVAGVNTDSQVCNLIHSKTSDELVGCFGYPLNEISLWSSKLNKIATFNNNKKGRVLYAAMDYSGERLITGNGVGDIDFWRPFDNLSATALSSRDCR